VGFLEAGELRLVLDRLETHEADLVMAIVAQGIDGPTRSLVDKLAESGALSTDVDLLRRGALDPGHALLVETEGAIAARYALFVGARDATRVTYNEIFHFARDGMYAVNELDVRVRTVALLAHGPGFGLDGIEAFLASVAGWLSTLRDGGLSQLERVTYVEGSTAKLEQMGEALVKACASGGVPAQEPVRDGATWVFRFHEEFPTDRGSGLEGLESDSKRHVFVAMPFAAEFEDVFYFGISGPVRSRGFVCERMDQLFFTGDILAQMRTKIEEAALVIADLTGANPNVYLEVGYAWGKGRPTILLIDDASELRFDVAGQRSLVYESIRHLAESLEGALDAFADQL
jgi:hypothetical protein